ncbi:helix-turn-helix transcriptional regulator [Nocardioides sp. J2M5]|uniref:helix-turn-helix domain-containing protein n=1 Tax=Nocardioides palaemonis TaxID=2829810 RepID=UPI001BA7623D|nr:helix-turn-helix transcriptional regulator [Nocardioides palaemonis]MBS2938160.1 helix-turn-helix transcriptional regulator [Nocardioides palaemonis]
MASGHASDRDAGDDRTGEGMDITGEEHGGAGERATAHDRHGGPHTRRSWAGAVAQDPSPDMADWTEAERVAWGLGPFDGGMPGMVRRVRRILDVSQRGLAALLGVSQSVVARWETGRTSPRVAMLQRILGLARLALTVHDEESGELVEPMRDDGARTRGGSRFPAHTDIRATGWWLPRHLRTWTSIEAWACQRRSRAALVPLIRHRTSPHWKRVERFLLGTPDDHPALHQMVAEVQSLDDLREARRRAAGNGHPHPAA